MKLKTGQNPSGDDLDFPNAENGLDGVKFIGKCVENSQKGAVWVTF